MDQDAIPEEKQIAEKTRPDIPPHLVVDFDITQDVTLNADLHAGLRRLQESAPSIFWTPRNGGHWVAARYETLHRVVTDWQTFSSIQTQIPLRKAPPIAMVPINLDPPQNAPFRVGLMKYFSANATKKMEADIRATAAELIDEIARKGRSELSRELALPFPVSVFMKMIGMPPEQYPVFRGLVVNFFETITDPIEWPRHAAALDAAVRDFVMTKKDSDDDDVVSYFWRADINGRRFSEEEVIAVCFLLVLAGLDSVGTATLFAFQILARSPERQAALASDPAQIVPFVEEALRMSGFVNTSRVATRDVEIDGAQIRAGEAVLCLLPLAGLDDRKNQAPLQFDTQRSNGEHMIFGAGQHICVGQYLARFEIQILIEEWLKRVPQFQIAPDFKPEFRFGQQMALTNLEVAWR